MSREQDPYSLLGVDRRASDAEISRAYRRAARTTHPDNRPDDPSAAGRFNELNTAYQTLRDPLRRADYDRAHPRVGAALRPTSVNAPPPVDLAALSRRRRAVRPAGGVAISVHVRISWFRA